MASKWKKCVVKGCRQAVGPRCHRNKCAKHHYHQWRDNHSLKCAFHHLRKRAKERGKDFSLTFEQYRDFAIKTDYARLKGKTSLSLSIDRINNDHGYHAWNIRAITLRENSRKLFTKIPEWMKDEIRACEAGRMPESHMALGVGE